MDAAGFGARCCFARQARFMKRSRWKGEVAPLTDPELKRKPRCYARHVRDLSVRCLVSLRTLAEATVGVFVVSRKQGKQMLIFDARRVDQHLRRPWHCVAYSVVLDWATTSAQLCVPHGTDRREHSLLSFSCARRNVRILHFARGVHSVASERGG